MPLSKAMGFPTNPVLLLHLLKKLPLFSLKLVVGGGDQSCPSRTFRYSKSVVTDMNSPLVLIVVGG